MIRAFRSHPCVSVWTLQNETSPDIRNLRIFLRPEQNAQGEPFEDILLKSGVGADNQAWTLPYSDEWLHDDGTGHAGWWDQHTAIDSPGSGWIRCTNRRPISSIARKTRRRSSCGANWRQALRRTITPRLWTGTRRTSGLAMIWRRHGPIVAAYERFLDDYHFRSAFPSAEKLFQEAAAKHYFSAAHLLENARICNNVDYIVLSGWESTKIDDHSGMVDSLRQLKADPALIRQASEPEVLVVCRATT